MTSRREFVRGLGLAGSLLLLGGLGCTRHRYIRDAKELDLGTVRELLYTRLHIRSKAILLFRDADGWSALSTRCTYRGCDLTYQEPVLLCPCCRTRYTLEGVPYQGFAATESLPWVDVYYREGHLFANPGKIREAKFRFTTPEIELAIRKVKARIKDEDINDEAQVPPALINGLEVEPGRMFLENDPNNLAELEMVK